MFVNRVEDKQKQREEVYQREAQTLAGSRPGARNTVEGLRVAVGNRTRQLEDYHDLCTSILEELKAYSYLVVPLIDDASKLARSQEIAKAVLSILKSTGSNEQKKLLSAALKKISTSTSPEETKVELLMKYSRAEKVSMWENKLDEIMEHGIDGIGAAAGVAAVVSTPAVPMVQPESIVAPAMTTPSAIADAFEAEETMQAVGAEEKNAMSPELAGVTSSRLSNQEYHDGVRDDKRMTMTVADNFVDLGHQFAEEWDPDGPETRFMRVAPRAVASPGTALKKREEVEKSGYIIKQGSGNLGSKSWKNRWFVLKAQALSYFKSPQDENPAGVIDLTMVTRVNLMEFNKVDSTQPSAHSLMLFTDSRNYVLCSDSIPELDEWKKAIERQKNSEITGPAPRLGRKLGGPAASSSNTLSTCPVCAQKFSKEDLIAHLDSQTCLIASPRSPRMVKSPRLATKDVFKRLADAAKSRNSDSRNSSEQQSQPSLGIISAPTGFKHESHTSQDGQVILKPEADEISSPLSSSYDSAGKSSPMSLPATTVAQEANGRRDSRDEAAAVVVQKSPMLPPKRNANAVPVLPSKSPNALRKSPPPALPPKSPGALRKPPQPPTKSPRGGRKVPPPKTPRGARKVPPPKHPQKLPPRKSGKTFKHPLPPGGVKRVGSPNRSTNSPVLPTKRAFKQRAARKAPKRMPRKAAPKRPIKKGGKGRGHGGVKRVPPKGRGKGVKRLRNRSASIGKAPLGQAPRPPVHQAPRPPPKRTSAPKAGPKSTATATRTRKSNRMRSVSVGTGSAMAAQMRMFARRPPARKAQATADVFEVSVNSAQTSPNVIEGVLRGRAPTGCWQFIRIIVGESKRQTDTHAATASVNFGKDALHFPYSTPKATVKIGLFLKRPQTDPDLLGSCKMTVEEALSLQGVAKIALLDHQTKVGSVCIQCQSIERTAEAVVAMQRVAERKKLTEDPKSATLQAMQKLDTQLFVDLRKPDLSATVAAIRSGDADFSQLTESGQDLMMMMCWLGDETSVSALLKSGKFDLKSRCNQRLSSIHYAVLSGNEKLVEKLVSVQAQLCSHPFYSLEPLHLAAFSGSTAIAKSLLTAGANVDEKDTNGATPLMYAVFNGNAELVEMLLEMGAFLDCEDNDATSPLLLAAMRKHEQIVSMLLSRKVDVNSQNINGECVVWCAIQANNSDMLLDVLEKRANLELELGVHEHTILQKAVLFLPDEALPNLMSTLYPFCNMNGTNLEDKSALFMACALGKVQTVTRLIKLGATVNHKDAYDNIPLHFALTCEIAEILLQHGAYVNQMNDEGVTPLHVACAFGLFDLKSCLLAHGADPTIRNCQGNSPLDLLSLSPPPDWKICMPFFKSDQNYVGGINIDDQVNPIHNPTSRVKQAVQAQVSTSKSSAASAGETMKRGLNMLRSKVSQLNQIL